MKFKKNCFRLHNFKYRIKWLDPLPNIISWCQQVFSLYKPVSLYSLPSHWKSALTQATLEPRTESVRPKEHKKNKQTKAALSVVAMKMIGSDYVLEAHNIFHTTEVGSL